MAPPDDRRGNPARPPALGYAIAELPRALIELMSEMQREIDIYDHSGDDVAVCFFLASLRL